MRKRYGWWKRMARAAGAGVFLLVLVWLAMQGLARTASARRAPVVSSRRPDWAPAGQAVTATVFPFGYYGLEEPVENGGFSPRVYIDSAM
ncbi:MAG: hypothetical protein D6796_17230, partial [Caldilineae bacterium]